MKPDPTRSTKTLKIVQPQFKWRRCFNRSKGTPNRVSVDSDVFSRFDLLRRNPILKGILKWWLSDHACRLQMNDIDRSRIYDVSLKSSKITINGSFRYMGTDRNGYSGDLWAYASFVTILGVDLINNNDLPSIQGLVVDSQRLLKAPNTMENADTLLHNWVKLNDAAKSAKRLNRPDLAKKAKELYDRISNRLIMTQSSPTSTDDKIKFDPSGFPIIEVDQNKSKNMKNE